MVRLPLIVLAEMPASPDLLAGAAKVTTPAPSFTSPAVPVRALEMESVEPVSAWNTPWTAARATTGALSAWVAAPVAKSPPEVSVSVVKADPSTVWAVAPENLTALTVLLAVRPLVVMAALASTVSVAPARFRLVVLVALYAEKAVTPVVPL